MGTKEKWVVGIDVSKESFNVCLKVLLSSGTVKIKGSHKFDNAYEGFRELESWIMKRITDKSCLQLVMEATGVYYEDLSYYFYEQGFRVCVLLANKSKNYAKSLNIKTKTDKVDSSMLASMGIERSLNDWQPMSPNYKMLRDLNRLYLSYKKQMNRVSNQLHAMQYAHEKLGLVIDQQKQLLVFYKQSIQKLEEEILKELEKDKTLYRKVQQLDTIPGVGIMTAIAVITETNGFELFNNIRQVVSFSGLDVRLDESGKHKGKSHISKKGNSRIRQVLFMPAMSAVQSNKPIKALHKRICEKNPTAKRKGIIAGLRKLLSLMFVLWRKDQAFDPDYQWKSGQR